jgi:hypothetical protein
MVVTFQNKNFHPSHQIEFYIYEVLNVDEKYISSLFGRTPAHCQKGGAGTGAGFFGSISSIFL